MPVASPDAAAAAEASGLGLDVDTFRNTNTVLRLKALTASSSQLLLPRGRHLLQLQGCPNQLHCVTLHAAAEFTLDAADKLLPSVCKMHVVRESGDTPALAAGSRQLLFRWVVAVRVCVLLGCDGSVHMRGCCAVAVRRQQQLC